MPKSLSDVADFMKRQRIASFATVDTDGKPHVVPVWFTYDDGKVFVQTDRGSVKAHNIENNNNVALAVYSAEEAVIIRGEARMLLKTRKNSSSELGNTSKNTTSNWMKRGETPWAYRCTTLKFGAWLR